MTTELRLLGTSGGPMPKANRAAPSQALTVGDSTYIVDFGNGVGRQLVLAGLDHASVEAGFLTHHHSDHNADLWTFFLTGWARLRHTVPVVGPPPMLESFQKFLGLHAEDLHWRREHSGRAPLSDFVEPREISRSGVVYEDDKVVVTAAVVEHPPVVPSFAYRFDTADRSVVFSGDTAPSEALVELARDCDFLVHEVFHPDHLQHLLTVSNPDAMLQHLHESHTSVHEVGKLATRAGAKTLVLTHLVPADTSVTDEMWCEAVAADFHGQIIVGRDLMCLDLSTASR
ncbi:hypothetical protein CH276_20310 [Rhodococcus sp. 06-470-2]|nr:hypothetical protein CH276_20310 [Rhodococcus sp. 06-470-2]OZE57194.1 hypothetical protein CH265_24005 [Rhodococcus sp. 05-2221-1B]